jgi:hypothetical protein
MNAAERLDGRRRQRCLGALVLGGALLGASYGSAQQAAAATAARANSYDNAWEDAWVAHARQVLSGATKSEGFVLHIGDSITHSRAYSSWPVSPNGATAADLAIIQWTRVAPWGTGTQDVNSRNGWYLAGADTTAWRGMTALSGASISELLFGCCNGDGVAMPSSTTTAEARLIVANPAYATNLHSHTLTAAFSDAQFAIVMLGTNDPATPENLANLTGILDTLESRHIVPILSTIPPRSDLDVTAFNASLVQLARSRALPLIDFYQEILLRRPGTTWLGTLISMDGVHPTGDNAGYTVNSNPYLPGGDPATQTTGDALLSVGYLLRGWLSVQKLSEVKRLVIDNNEPPSATLTGPAPGTTYGAPATVSLAADASDPDGFISRVDFYRDGTLAGSDTTSPYELTLSDVAAGNYSLTARAVDNINATGDSAPVAITVVAPSLHIGDLDGGGAVVAKQTWRATVSVTVHSGAETLVSGALVTGTWSGAARGTATCTTSAAGSCSVSTGNINTKKGSSTGLSLTSVSHPSYLYQASANHDVDGGSNGSSISVQAP